MPKVFGDPPITVENKVYNDTLNKLRQHLNDYRNKTDKAVNTLWNNKQEKTNQLELLTQLFLVGKLTKRQDAFRLFAEILRDTFGVASPATGALWGGDGAQEQAKSDLLTRQNASVLSESKLGKVAKEMSLAPQGPMRNETGPEFAARNQAALQFWGAVSALYAQYLTGEVHVWMPHGLTVGSIFWNDELPVLMKRKRDGEPFDLIFHVNPANWNETVSFDELVISGAYVADKNGYYAGRANLKAKHNPPTGDADTDLKESMTLKLTSPIKLATVRFAMQALLTYMNMKRHNAIREQTLENGVEPRKLSPAVLAKLAVWRERARIEAAKNT